MAGAATGTFAGRADSGTLGPLPPPGLHRRAGARGPLRCVFAVERAADSGDQCASEIRARRSALRVPVSPEQLDAALQTAESRGDSHLAFLWELLGTAAADREERAIARRIRVDEFGLDYVERRLDPQAGHLLFKVIAARNGKSSTALGTNIEFDAWGEYLGDAPLAMALLDRVVDRAVLLNILGKSYRASRAKRSKAPRPPEPNG